MRLTTGVIMRLGSWLSRACLRTRFAGAGFAQHQAQAALLGVDAEDVEDFLLVCRAA